MQWLCSCGPRRSLVMNTQLCWLSFQSVHLKIDSHFSLLPAYILLISYKNDKVFSLSITDVCGLTAGGPSRVIFTGYPSRTPHSGSPHRGLVGGTRQRHFAGTSFKPRNLPACTLPQAQVKTRRLPPPAPMLIGVRVHYPGAVPGRCVGRLVTFILNHICLR